MNTKQKGMITIEASLTLIMFITVMACMVTAINIFIVHNKVQYAITQTSNRLSMYLYLYDALGVKDVTDKIGDNIDQATENLNDTSKQSSIMIDDTMKMLKDLLDITSITDSVDHTYGGISQAGQAANDLASGDLSAIDDISGGLDAFGQGITETEDSIKKYVDKMKIDYKTVKEQGTNVKNSLSEWGKKIKENPYTLVMTLIYVCAEQAMDGVEGEISENICRAFMTQYLDDSDLAGVGVKGGIDSLDFTGTNIFKRLKKSDTEYFDNVRIEIFVTYDVKLPFPFLPLSDNTMHMIQNSSSAAWTGIDYADEHKATKDEKKDEEKNQNSQTETQPQLPDETQLLLPEVTQPQLPDETQLLLPEVTQPQLPDETQLLLPGETQLMLPGE